MSIFDIFKQKPTQEKMFETMGEIFASVTSRKKQNASTEAEQTMDGSFGVSTPIYWKLHDRYRKDPFIKANVDMYVRLVAASWPAKFDVVGDNKSAQKRLDYLVGRTNLRRLWCGQVALQCVLYGGAFVEYLRNGEKTKIVDFATRSPINMDFVRENDLDKGKSGESKLNNYGDFYGFIWMRNNATSKHIFLNKQDMSYIRINQTDNGQYGLGFVEPLLTDLQIRENVEQAIGKNALRMTRPIVRAVYTTIDGKSPAGLKDLADRVASDYATFYNEDSVQSRFISHPDTIKPEIDFGTQIPPQYMEYLNYSTMLFSAAFGLPYVKSSTDKISEQNYDLFFMVFNGFLQEMDLKGFLENQLALSGHPGIEVQFKYRPISTTILKEETMRIMRMLKVIPQLANDPKIVRQLTEWEGLYLDAEKVLERPVESGTEPSMGGRPENGKGGEEESDSD